MGGNTQENALILVNQRGFLNKIKNFFRKLFNKVNYNDVGYNYFDNIQNNETKNEFLEKSKSIQDEETKLIKIQKEFNAGRIKAEELSITQIKKLINWYDKQIENISKINQVNKQKVLEYKKQNI